jgi:hypothetical protein
MSFAIPSMKGFIKPITVAGGGISSTLLLHFDEVSTTVNDSSANNVSVSYYSYTGTATSVNTYKKFGAGSFDSTPGFANITKSSLFDFSNQDFTIDFWYKPYFAGTNNSTTAIQMYHFHTNLFNQSSASLPGIGLRRASRLSNEFWLQISSDGATFDINQVTSTAATFDGVVGSADTTNSQTWHHIALERYSNNIYFYIDGTINLSVAYSNSIYNSSMYNLGFGQCWTSTYSALNATTAFYDEFRIVKGTAIYRGANFTPPTSAYTS